MNFRFVLVASILSVSAANAAPVVLDRLEASVNSSMILLSDVKKFRSTMKLQAQLDPLFSQSEVAKQGPSASNSQIVHYLIDEALITQQYPVTESEADQQIGTIQAENHIDRGALKTALSEQGFSFDDYRDKIKVGFSKRKLIDNDIRTKVTVSRDDAKNEYLRHSQKTDAQKFYKLHLIVVSLKTYKTPSAAKDVAQRAWDNIQKGEAFEEVAKRASDVQDSADSGGHIASLSEKQMLAPIREQVKKMKIGDVSPVFGGQSLGAYYVVKLLEERTGDSDEYEKELDKIQRDLAATEYDHQISLWLERERQKAIIHRAGEPSTAALPSAQ